jgi:hypothetical protein
LKGKSRSEYYSCLLLRMKTFCSLIISCNLLGQTDFATLGSVNLMLCIPCGFNNSCFVVIGEQPFILLCFTNIYYDIRVSVPMLA